MTRPGWYLVAFERDLTDELNPAAIGTLPLALLRTAGGIRAFDAACPHRGAHLAFGGRVCEGEIICPFHGYRVGLARESADGFRAREYPVLQVGGLVLARLSIGPEGSETGERENGLTPLLEELDRTHRIVPGFATSVRAAPEIIIENGFDSAHFRTVHGIQNEPSFAVVPSRFGEYAVEGVFEYPLPPWQQGHHGEAVVRVPFVARAFSPFLAVTNLGGENPYWVITGATPAPDGSSIVRVSFAVPRDGRPEAASAAFCEQLLYYSQAGLEQDRVLWENLTRLSRPRYTRRDVAVLGFQKFCRGFTEAGWAAASPTEVRG